MGMDSGVGRGRSGIWNNLGEDGVMTTMATILYFPL